MRMHFDGQHEGDGGNSLSQEKPRAKPSPAAGDQALYATVMVAQLYESGCTQPPTRPSRDATRMMGAVVNAHEGIVAELSAARCLALFGHARPLSSHAAQAVAAALGMLDHLALINRSRVDQGGLPLRLGIGINTGSLDVSAVAGDAGAPVQYRAAGSAVRVACHLSLLNRQTPFPAVFVGAGTRHELHLHHHAWHLEELGESACQEAETDLPIFAVMPRVEFQ